MKRKNRIVMPVPDLPHETALFADHYHPGPRIVEFPNGDIWWQGGPPPDPLKTMDAEAVKHGFCLEHKAVIDAFLDVYRERNINPLDFLHELPLSDLMRRINVAWTEENQWHVKGLINDLHYTFTRFKVKGSTERAVVRVIRNLGAKVDTTEFYIQNICFDDDFMTFYPRWKNQP